MHLPLVMTFYHRDMALRLGLEPCMCIVGSKTLIVVL
jgi:hypothetical protein